MSIKRRYIIHFIIIIVLFLGVAFYIHLRSIREHIYWYVEQSLINDDKVELKFDLNSRKEWFSFPGRHPFIIIGGGDLRLDIYFIYKGQEHNFGKIGSPVLINYWNSFFYIVTLSSKDSKAYNSDFHFYRYDKGCVRIKSEEFPKSIAIPNINYVRNYPEISEPDIINPDIKDFRYSLTAKLWLRLKKGIHYYETKKGFKTYEVDKDFLVEYKKKYIDPYWNQKALKDNYPKVLR